jgi:hypothetical protein
MDIDVDELTELMSTYGFSVRDGYSSEINFYHEHGKAAEDVGSHTLYALRDRGVELVWYNFLYDKISQEEILKHHHRKLPGLSRTLNDLTFDGRVSVSQVALLLDLIFVSGQHRDLYTFSDYIDLVNLPGLTYMQRVSIVRAALSPSAIGNLLDQRVPFSLTLELLV